MIPQSVSKQKNDQYNTKDTSSKQQPRKKSSKPAILNLFQGFEQSVDNNNKNNNNNSNSNNNDFNINEGIYQIPQNLDNFDLTQTHKIMKNSNSEIDQLLKLFPYQINQIIVEIAQADLDYDSDEDEAPKQIKRVKQSKYLFALLVICSLITGTENLYIFLGTMPYRDVYFTFPTVILRLILLPIISIKMCNNWNVLLRLLFMVDKIMLSALLTYIGVMGFILIFLPYTPSAWFYQSLCALYPIMWLFYAGAFRVMMVYGQWSKVQVLIFKFTLLVGSTSYFVLGVYYLVGKLRFTRGLRPQLDQSIENLLLIYINAGFQVYLEMIARMDTVDGTSSFKLNYKLHCNPQHMEMLLKGRDTGIQSENSDSDTDSQSDPTETQDHPDYLFKKALSQIQQVSVNASQSIVDIQESSRKFNDNFPKNKQLKKFGTIDFSEDNEQNILNMKVQDNLQAKQVVEKDSQSILDLSDFENANQSFHKQYQGTKLRRQRKNKAAKINLDSINLQPENSPDPADST